ncbi:3-hexulose-6-phosphate synthase [Salipaludibacillus aurantiacus]|uniref:3-hexulose-6-phosphate synthase n=1 Tax=Salipaludibacillus aurantiacus TaxID=1601833 RepID=A0A1H9UD14_9BACI|nr:3-hexulose-6-phosphate synthase [Salipaludibacillus aurantiacus]SES07345.1 3-hexulose-6-phosphate synthase [Salipaludibacillus aurantiacus]
MKLQLALDRLERQQCFRLLEETKDHIDWIEVGTGVIKEYGMSIVREIKQRYPNHTLVADMKTCDAGKHEARQAFEAGADVVTVMAFAADETIKDMLFEADSYGKQVMADLLNVSEKRRLDELKEAGVTLVSLHYGKDMQKEKDMSADLFDLVKGGGFTVSVAGGIKESTLPEIVANKPDIVIVGSAITSAEDPANASFKLKGMLTPDEEDH